MDRRHDWQLQTLLLHCWRVYYRGRVFIVPGTPTTSAGSGKKWTQRTNSVRERVDPSNLISMCKIGKRNSEYGNRYEETVKMMVDRKGTSKNSCRTGDIDTELTCSTEKRGDIDTKVTYSTEKGHNIKTEVTYSVEKGVDAETEVTFSTDIDINVEVTTAAKASNKPSLLFDTMYYSEKLWTNFTALFQFEKPIYNSTPHS